MAALHAALRSLEPVSIDDIPTENADLYTYLRDLLVQARLIVESVPEPPSLAPTGSTTADNPSNQSSRAASQNGSKISASRSTPALDSGDIHALQKEWGRPFNKVDNVKENPMRIPVYKLRSKDGKGAWFARRSVHAGTLSYSRFKDKLQNELAETMKLREETGEGVSIRGVGSERRLEQLAIPLHSARADTDSGHGDELAVVEVHHLSAHFPGPSTSRDFVTLLVSSDKTMDVSSTAEDGKTAETPDLPRNFVIISKPCKHPDAPIRKGFIRGQYESVEMIRELPASAVGNSIGGSENEENANPVEWIMITRSDPGGNIPRWMVEKGTVPSIIADAKKFIDWATRDEQEINEGEEGSSAPQSRHDSGNSEEKPQPLESVGRNEVEKLVPEPATIETRRDSGYKDSRDETNAGQFNRAGLAAGIMETVSSTLESVAPKGLFDYLDLPTNPKQSADEISENGNENETEDRSIDAAREGAAAQRDSPVSSIASFTSADSCPRSVQQEVGEQSQLYDENNSLKSAGFRNDQGLEVPGVKGASSASSSVRSLKQDLLPSSFCDKDLAKLAIRKAKVVNELEINNEQRNKLMNQLSHPLASDVSASDADQETPPPASAAKKATASHKKDLAALKRKEAKLTSRLQKIESQQQKVQAKAESKRRKESEKAEMGKLKAELESLKEEKEQMRVEIDGLRQERSHWLSIVGRLQQENTKLATQLPQDRSQ
ncbi:predicted protein [Uncinocarpus reesii 1704]|uniref:DUF3074 domain-containing protein n=1 Tax=Uncinocarpus reesii (strain UAMH 1704) TaxID=336963 RepID=C4JKC3_UNCRE|nr:uncharacterized protein UREG_02080 [Uncinocarpus reesii 1704]EEP77231.1 predicted protein [Uncinocarpus reesii 1704]